ncbi:glycosyltransferase [Glaciimonas sp. GS1]|uniref:Glycosyltransferase n=1 Tax=Glaciimonas soli TaxID=2590999 RepID=A0A843Z174_9BURK|nr:glycosyltransferase [Glaciimonas soli]
MTIALNSKILLAPRTGIGNYVVELAQALQQDAGLKMHYFYGSRWQETLVDAPMPGYSRWANIVKRYLPGAYVLRRAFEQKRFNRGVRKACPDVYHEPSLWPLNFAGPTVMTVHDLTHIHYPQTQPKDRLKEIERRLPSALARVNRILVDSAFIGDEIKQHYSVPEQKIVVAPLGCAAIFQPRVEPQVAIRLKKLGLHYRGFILSVGTLEPRKNLLLTLKAHARLPLFLRERFPLLVVGMQGWHVDQLQGALSQAVSAGHVRLAGYLDQADLACVTAAARIMVFPSLYEGFGLPVLEAMTSGTPVITSDCASLPEVAAEAGIYVDPQDEEGLAEQMRCLMEDDEIWMAQHIAGLERSAQFSWKKCASVTAEVYRQAANS